MNKISNKGKIIISKNAFKDIADICIRKIKNVFPIKKDTSYISVNYTDKVLNFDIKLKVKRDIDVNRISEKIQKDIYDAVYAMTSIKCDTINVNIQGFEN